MEIDESAGEPFLWTSADGMRSVMDILTDDYGLGSSLTGWTLNSVSAISADGLTTVGPGTNPDGDTEAWMASMDSAVVPEPNSLALLGIRALGLFGYGRRRRQTSAAARGRGHSAARMNERQQLTLELAPKF